MTKSASITMRIDPDKKTSAEELFASLGMTFSEAVNIFINMSLIVGGIPFEIRQPRYNQETEEAFAEGDAILAGTLKHKKYKTAEDMMTDILKEP